MRYKIEEKSDTRYGYWIVREFDKISNHGDAKWWCTCNLCGRDVSVNGFALRNGTSTKCKNCARRLKRD